MSLRSQSPLFWGRLALPLLLLLSSSLVAYSQHVYPEATCVEYPTAPGASEYIAHFSYLDTDSTNGVNPEIVRTGASQHADWQLQHDGADNVGAPPSIFYPGYHRDAMILLIPLGEQFTWQPISADPAAVITPFDFYDFYDASITTPPPPLPTPTCTPQFAPSASLSYSAPGTYTNQFLGQVNSGPAAGSVFKVLGLPLSSNISVANLTYIPNDAANPTSSLNPNSIYGDITISYGPATTSGLRLDLLANGAQVAHGITSIAYTGPSAPPDNTSVVVSTPFNLSVPGSSLLVTASVSDSTTPGTIPTGSMTFYDTLNNAVTTLGTVTLSNGIATQQDTFLNAGSHTISATYNPSSPLLFSASTGTDATPVVVSLLQASVVWDPSTLSIYTGTPLGTKVLDAFVSPPATTIYSAYLQPSGSPVAVTPGTVLSQGIYGLQLNVTPTNPEYASTLLQLPFTVQNMNVFLSNSIGSVSSLFNIGTVQSYATTGGGIGAAVDSNGNVWSISSDGNSIQKFTDSGALAASYNSTGINGAKALALDGSGNVWISNGNGSITILTNTGTAQFTISGSTTSAASSVAIDQSGSAWLTNPTTNSVDEIIGGATPANPLSIAVTLGQPATQP